MRKVKLKFQKSKDSIDTEKLKKYLKSESGISARFDTFEETFGAGKDGAKRQKKTFVVLTCRKKQSKRLLAFTPSLKLKYPSFKQARRIVRKSHKTPKGTRLIQLTFKDKLSNWLDGRPIQLIKDVARITGMSEETIDLVEVKEGSVIIILRVPESGAEALIKTSSEGELKAKYSTLKTVEPIADRAESIADLPEPVTDSPKIIQATADWTELLEEPAEPMTDPPEPMTDPPEPMTDPPEPMTDPPEPMTDPPEPMASSTNNSQPISAPRQPLASPSTQRQQTVQVQHGSSNAVCVACPGYVRKSRFNKTCKTCDKKLRGHPPVKLSIEGREMDHSAWQKVEPKVYRLVYRMWKRLQKNCIPALQSVINAWKFKENHGKSQHRELCSQFLEDAEFSVKSHLGCCFRMIKEHNQMERVVKERLERKAVDDLEISSPKGFRQYNFLMKCWVACKVDMLEYDKMIKNDCGRTDFIDPGCKLDASSSPPFGDKKRATVCPVCNNKFGVVIHKKRHCRHCLRVVCGKCAEFRAATLGGPMVRLCTDCLPF